MVDNLGKNLLLKTWDPQPAEGINKRWYATFYDMDTILGLSNAGDLVHPPSVDIDAYPTGNFVVDRNNPDNLGAGDYNLSKSRLWQLLFEYYYEFETNSTNIPTSVNLKQRYTNLRKSGVLSYDNLIKPYLEVIDSIGANYYNKDAEIKYLNKFTNETGVAGYYNTKFLHGTREHYTKLWIKRRLLYLDSLFDATDPSISDSQASKKLSFRLNSAGASSVREFYLNSRATQFISAYWSGADTADVSKLLVTPKANNDDAGTLFRRSFNAQEQSTDINFGPEITEINGLNGSNPSSLDLSSASSLTKLDLQGDPYLRSIILTGCVSLRELNVSNCPNLGNPQQQGEQDFIDVSNSKNLQYLNISNTNLQRLVLPDGGTLQELICNNSKIQDLDISGQSFLERVDLTGCTNLVSIDITNCPRLKEVILSNTALSSFAARDVPSLETVIISNSSRLTSVDFQGAPNVKTLDVSGCRNINFTTINLLGAKTLETLIMTNCSARLLRFQDNTSLKTLTATGSGLVQTEHNGVLGKWNTTDAVDLSPFTSLTSVRFTNCNSLLAVVNFNATLNGTSMFSGCTNLLRITGNLTLTGSAQNLFYNCQKLKLYDSTVTGGIVTLPSDTATFPLNLILNGVTSFVSACYNCQQFDIGQLYYLCRRLINVTNLASAFRDCIGVVTNLNQPLPSNIFEKCTKVTSIANVFYLNRNMTGDLPVDLLYSMPNITNATEAFSGCKFNTLPQNFLARSNKLTTALRMFQSNAFTNTVNGQALLTGMIALTVGENMFNGSGLNVTLIDDTLFRFCGKLTNATSMFTGCNVTGTIHPNLFGGVSPTGTGVENGQTVTYHFPTGLTTISNIFQGSGNLIGTLSSDLFKNLISLQQAANVFNGTGISGEIPEGLFQNNVNLLNISGFFAGTKVTSIPNNLLSTLTRLTNISNLFSGCSLIASDLPLNFFTNNQRLTNMSGVFRGCTGLGGYISEDFFTVLDEEGFATVLGVTDLSYFFYQCYNLGGTIPENLFQWTRNVTNLSYFFYDCGTVNHEGVAQGISGPIPENLFSTMPSLTNINYMFWRCNQLDPTIIIPDDPAEPTLTLAIPRGLFTNNSLITTMSYTFAYCSKLFNREIPLGVFDPLINVTNMSGLFYSAIGGTIPIHPDLFIRNNKLENISLMFSNDSSESSPSSSWNVVLPSNLFRPYVRVPLSGHPIRTASSAFAKCTSLRGQAPALWTFTNPVVPSGTAAFRYATNLTNYADIPNNWK